MQDGPSSPLDPAGGRRERIQFVFLALAMCGGLAGIWFWEGETTMALMLVVGVPLMLAAIAAVYWFLHRPRRERR